MSFEVAGAPERTAGAREKVAGASEKPAVVKSVKAADSEKAA